MSTEVVVVDSDVTGSHLGGENQNNSDVDRPQESDRANHEEGHRDLKVDSKHQKQGIMETLAPADEINKGNVNNKENDQNATSNNADSREKAKKKVIEAPPPKVNPWTKKNACPSNNPTTSNSQETGWFVCFNFMTVSVATLPRRHCNIWRWACLESSSQLRLAKHSSLPLLSYTKLAGGFRS